MSAPAGAPARPSPVGPRPAQTPRAAAPARLETLGYALLALALGALLFARVRHVDGFYLDEWMYTQGAEHMWANLPLGPFEQIDGWTRGPQRLYTYLLAASWGPLEPSPAYTLSHLVNIALLVSSVWPAALLARRVIDELLLRLLAVALAVAVPWLLISANLLTENLAFPLFLWTVWAIVAAAERSGWGIQLAALGCIVALTLCRLNLAVMLVVLVIAVLGAEVARARTDSEGLRAARLRVALRRRTPIVVALVLGLAGAIGLVLGGGSRLGAYGGFTDASTLDRIWGEGADESGRAALTYLRSLVTGSFVVPVVLGLATSFAGVRGRLGPRLLVASIAALASFACVLAVVSISTASAVTEERYVFYIYAPLAILAVAGVRSLSRAIPELVVAGGVVVFALAQGFVLPGSNSGNFFAAPAGAFWTRVVDHRIRAFEDDALGSLPGAGDGWLLVAGAVALMVLAVIAFGARPQLRALLALGLALCLVAQVAVLHYDFGKLLDGTPEAPGGLALSADRSLDRETWIDDALPDGARAAILPALSTPQLPYGDTERQQFWNESLDAAVALGFAFTPTSIPPGFRTIGSTLDDGLATWDGPRYDLLVAQPDDPRVQFDGRLVARSRTVPLGLFRLEPGRRAIWTAQGLDYDGAVLQGGKVTMTLDRGLGNDVSAVTLELRAPQELTGAVRWAVEDGAGGRAASGTLEPGATRRVRLAASTCPSGCARSDVWRLTATGAIAALPPPYVGAPPPPRPVHLLVSSAVLDR